MKSGVEAMEGTKIRKFRLFWAWQDHEEEIWLRQMAQQGFHFSALVFPMIYEFVCGEPQDVIYRMDYPDVRKQDIETYLQLFQDAGWEHIESGMGWYYFCKPAISNNVDEIFTDAESKIQKYERMLAYFIIFPLTLFVVLIPQITSEHAIPALTLLLFALLVFWIITIIRILKRIQQLKRL